MAKGSDKNHVSFWFWFFALFVMALPCVGGIMIFIWALVGENESRKNYFRALLAWFALGILFSIALMALGFWPAIRAQFESWLQRVR